MAPVLGPLLPEELLLRSEAEPAVEEELSTDEVVAAASGAAIVATGEVMVTIVVDA